jgi:hypothetical protein
MNASSRFVKENMPYLLGVYEMDIVEKIRILTLIRRWWSHLNGVDTLETRKRRA